MIFAVLGLWQLVQVGDSKFLWMEAWQERFHQEYSRQYYEVSPEEEGIGSLLQFINSCD